MTDNTQENHEIRPLDRADGTQERVRRDKESFLLILAESTGIITLACQRAQIARTTFYNWYNGDSEFKTRVEEIKKEQIGTVEDRLFKAILEGNVAAMIFFLKCKHPGFKPKSEVSLDSESIDKAIAELKKFIQET